MRLLTLLAVAAVLAGCASSDDDGPHQIKQGVKTTAKTVGHKTERTFKHIGHKMHDFFRGEESAE